MKVGNPVEPETIIDKWVIFNDKYKTIWMYIILISVGIASTVADWMVGIFSLSDFIFGFILICLIISNNYRITVKQIIGILILLGILSANIVVNYYNNDLFVLKTGIAALIKVAYYAVVLVGCYNLIKNRKQEKRLLKIINVIAILISIIGIYITLAIYLNGKLPYEFFWKFTRTDATSYLYDGIEHLYRTRSIFSEPSYLGYYLNIVLGMNYFNKWDIKINKYISLFITVTIILTFSYSSIAVMLVIQVLHFFTLTNLKKIRFNWFYLLCLIALIIVISLFWDIIQVTIIDRTMSILDGTDYSTRGRLLESWQYVNHEHIFMGNGIGHTPSIWNIYAYILSDVGLIVFLLFCLLTIFIVVSNAKLGILFICLNFQKGGYLSPEFWLFLLMIVIFMGNGYFKKDKVGIFNKIN